jgi:hypothetical protein
MKKAGREFRSLPLLAVLAVLAATAGFATTSYAKELARKLSRIVSAQAQASAPAVRNVEGVPRGAVALKEERAASVQQGDPQRQSRPPLVAGHPFFGDVRDLPWVKPRPKERPERQSPERVPVSYGSAAQAPSQEATVLGLSAPAPPLLTSFDGLDLGNRGAGHPPDSDGDVGPTYYIQGTDTSIGIYHKSSGVQVAALTFDSLMSQGQFGNPCDTDNSGRPTVLYDSFEDRWVLSDLAYQADGDGDVVSPPGAFQCFAVSRNGDPVSGGWNFYSINTAGGLGDDPKLAIWPDGLYMSANMFNSAAAGHFQNVRVYAFNKQQMYAGAPVVQSVSFDAPAAEFSLLPSNARLQAGTPPSGTPNLYAVVWQFTNAEAVYKFHVDWNNLANSSFTGPFVSVAPTSWTSPPGSDGNTPDPVAVRLTSKNEYTNIGGIESLWTTHTVQGAVAGQASPRYYQVDVTGGVVAESTTQAFTHSPDATTSRFMPSTAVDRSGNMAIGYGTSNASSRRAVRYAGRLSSDPPNSLSQMEQPLIQGTDARTGSCASRVCSRWGNHSAMTLDPDGCTFWYSSEYHAPDDLGSLTRIGSFRFSSCTPRVSGTVQGTVTAPTDGTPIAGALVALGSRTATTSASGQYQFAAVPSGTYPTLTAGAPGFVPGAATSIVVTDGSTTTQNFALSATAQSGCLTDTTQADFQAGTGTNVDLTSSPDNVVLASVTSLDQQNTTLGTSGFAVSTTQWIGQAFTPSVSGMLTTLDINMFCMNCSGANPPVTIDIRATNGGLPTSTVLASTTIPGFSSGSALFYTASFGSPPSLTAGTTYAILARLTTARTTGNYEAAFSNANPYAGGTLVFTTNGGSSFSSLAADDLGFRTTMSTGFVASGTLVSSLKDANPAAGSVVTWSTLLWNSAAPAGTNIQLQAAASDSAAGPFNFVGPDGTSGTFFGNGDSISQFNGFRYLKYEAFLSTSDPTLTPTLQDVTLCFNDQAPATPTPTATSTPTNTATSTPTNTPTSTPTNSPTSTPTMTPTATPTSTSTATFTPTATATSTSTATCTPTATATATPTSTPTATPSNTPTFTPSNSPTPTATPTLTPSPTATATTTSTATSTPTQTAVPTVTPSPTASPTSTPTQTATPVPSATPTSTPQPTSTATTTNSPTFTPTATSSPTSSPTPTATQTATSSPTQTPTRTSTPSSSPTATRTPTSSPTLTASVTSTPTVSVTPTPSSTRTPTGTPNASFTPTPTPSGERTLTALSPARVWVGSSGGRDEGIRFDLQANVYLGRRLVGFGQLGSVPGGGDRFRDARLDPIPLTLPAPIRVLPGEMLSIQILARNACSGSEQRRGKAKLWYNGQPADTGPAEDAGSRFDATIGGSNRDYFLRKHFVLSPEAGASRTFVETRASERCGAFQTLGVWSARLP